MRCSRATSESSHISRAERSEALGTTARQSTPAPSTELMRLEHNAKVVQQVFDILADKRSEMNRAMGEISGDDRLRKDLAAIRAAALSFMKNRPLNRPSNRFSDDCVWLRLDADAAHSRARAGRSVTAEPGRGGGAAGERAGSN